MDLTSITPGPEGLRALSHPVRLRMLGLLRLEGPATATTLARRLGLNTGATSYHLRTLAQHGFIEEDENRGNARDRWWRATHQATRTSSAQLSEDEHDTHDAYLQAVGVMYAGQLQRAIEQDRTLPDHWRGVGTFSDWALRLTPERAQELKQAIVALVEDFAEDTEDTPGALPFEVNVNAYLHPDAVQDASSLDTGPQDTGPQDSTP